MKIRFPLIPVIKTAAVLCFLFPLVSIYAILAGVFGDGAYDSVLVPVLVAFLLAGGIGLCCGAFPVARLRRKNGRFSVLLSNILLLFVAIACAAAGFAAAMWLLPLPSGNSYLYMGAVAVGCFISVLLCCRIWEWDYDNILTRYYLIFLMIADVLCCFLCWIFRKPLEYSVLSLTFLTSACVYAAAKNQGNIDYLMTNRSNRSTSILPKRMRWYSFSLVALIFVCIFGGYFLRKPIAALFNGILQLFKTLFVGLIRLLPSDSGEYTESDTPTQMSPQDMGLPMDEGGSSPLWSIIGVLLIFLIIGLIIYYRREIWNAIRSIAAKIRDAALSFFLHSRTPSALADVNQYFEDNVEEVSRDPGSFWKQQRPYDIHRFKKDYRAFRKMNDSPEKYREGYRLAMLLLLLKKKPIIPADTPVEILHKAGNILPPDLFACVTESYCQVRYGDAFPSESQMSELTSLLSEYGK